MKPIVIAGVLLIVLGLAALVYQGVSYTSRETVIDIGPITATADRQKTAHSAGAGNPYRRWRRGAAGRRCTQAFLRLFSQN